MTFYHNKKIYKSQIITGMRFFGKHNQKYFRQI